MSAMRPRKSPITRSGESSVWQQHRLDCAALSAAGAGRSENDDSLVFAAPGSPEAERAGAGYLFAVADGDGPTGRSAARETRTSLLEILDDPRRIDLRPDLLMYRLQDANDRCHRVLRGRCSVTAVWLWEDPAAGGLVAGWAHVGHTRLYRQADRGWRQVTRDHAKGRLLDRAVGQGPGMEIDTGTVRMRPGERLVLLTSGVWRTASPERALSPARLPPTAEAVRQLVGQARLQGSREDTTAIVIAVGRHGDAPEPEH